MAIPPDIRRGEIITADFLNAVKNAIVRDITTDGKITLTRTGANIALGLGVRIPGTNAPILARITSLSNDSLTVKRVDAAGAVTGNEITAAKPWKLRHDAGEYPLVTTLTTTNSNTVDVSDGTTDETWHVTPIYTVNDYVMIARDPYSGLEGVTWIDLNVGGRAWAKEAEA